MPVDVMRTRAALHDLEARWREQGPAVDRWWRPPVNEDEVDRLSSALPFPLPVEAVEWYRWHDGFRTDVFDTVLPNGFYMAPLADCLEEYQRLLSEPDYSGAWFPLTLLGSRRWLIDLSVEAGAPTPIRAFDTHEARDTSEILCSSLTELVETFSSAFADGWWAWDRGAQEWDRNLIPPSDLMELLY